MVVYLINFFIVTLLSIFAVRYSSEKKIYGLNIKRHVPNLFFVSIMLFCFMSVYALRWYVGSDFGYYYNYYFYYGELNLLDIIGVRDWGFYSIAVIMNKISPDNFILYNYVLAALTYVPILLIIRKYSPDFILSTILYITTMFFYNGFNGVRQTIAVSICFFAYPLLFNKKYIKYTIYILIAYLFHSTALLMLPLMIIVTQKARSKTILLIFLILLVTLLALPNLWVYLINLLELIGQEKMANDYSKFNYNDDGVNFLRVLVALLPVGIALVYYKKLKLINPKIDILINMSLLHLVFLLFGSQMTVLARIAIYFGVFNILLIPEIANLLKGYERIFFKYITVILFFIYMLLLLPVDSDLLPYRFIFNQGP